MCPVRPALLAACLVVAPAAYAQDDSIKEAIRAQQRQEAIRQATASESDAQRLLNRKLVDIAREFWLSAKMDGLKFENVVGNIEERNAAVADFGQPLSLVEADDTHEFAVTSMIGEERMRPWVALLGASSGFGANMSPIDGEVVGDRMLAESGGVDPLCHYRVTFANDGSHDDYAKEYPCTEFLAGDLDQLVIADIKRWAVDLLRHAAP